MSCLGKIRMYQGFALLMCWIQWGSATHWI